MNKKELNHFFAAISPTEEQTDRVLQQIMHIKNKQIKRYRKKTAMLLVAAFILMITALTAIAAAYHWHDKLIEYFKPTEKQMEELQGMLDTPQVTATKDGITVNVLQTIADYHGIYVLYELTSENDIAFDGTVSWEFSHLKVKYSPKDAGVGKGGGYAYNKVLDCEDNKCTMLYIRAGNGDILDQKLEFELSGLRRDIFNDKTECVREKISDVTFHLAWDFQYQNCGKELVINKEINDGKNVLRQIDISPISLWIMVSGEEMEKSTVVEAVYKNGKTQSIDLTKQFSYSPIGEGLNTISYELDEIINVSDIVGIQIGSYFQPINE